MDVPLKCTIVRAMDKSAYSSKHNPQKKLLCSVSVKPLISSVTNSYNNHWSCAHL